MKFEKRAWMERFKVRKIGVKSPKGSFTVEAALLCPFLCLMLCSMLLFTLRLYYIVDEYAEQRTKRQEWSLIAPELIRLEAVMEDLF